MIESGGDRRDPPLVQTPTTSGPRSHLLSNIDSSTVVMTNKKLPDNEIWDDSALVQSWNEALEEYKVNCTSTAFDNHVLTISYRDTTACLREANESKRF